MYPDLYFSNKDSDVKAAKFRLFSRHAKKWVDLGSSTPPRLCQMGQAGKSIAPCSWQRPLSSEKKISYSCLTYRFHEQVLEKILSSPRAEDGLGDEQLLGDLMGPKSPKAPKREAKTALAWKGP